MQSSSPNTIPFAHLPLRLQIAGFGTFVCGKARPLNKKILIAVTNDLSTDQRVDKVARTLLRNGNEVTLFGREMRSSQPLDQRPYKTQRFRLPFEKGALFYACYNIRLFLTLLFRKSNLIVANDLDTLPASFLAARLRKVPLVFDSHEYFTGVPELEGRPLVHSIWKRIERSILPRVRFAYTVNRSIADLYEKEYGICMKVVRNLPDTNGLQKEKSREELGLPVDQKIVILQGAGINVDRGGEELIDAMKFLDDTLLLIIGSGDVIPALRRRATEQGLDDKVRFIGKLPYLEMMQYTMNADLGATLDKDTNVNYRYSLPNKLFDYIQAGLPVLASDLPEVGKIVREHDLGLLTKEHDPEHLAGHILTLFNDPERMKELQYNVRKAAGKLKWGKEKAVLLSLYQEALT